MMELHRRKNSDYGNAAHESYKEFGLNSYIIRLNDKMRRLKSLTGRGVDISVKDESIEDTLMDLAAYAIMAIESLRN
jgi:(p)ppGpp synthase/HD superfamily hydrolase